MPRDSESLKIKPWASRGDRVDPESSSLDPVLTREIGWPESFSSDGGDTPRRQVFNQILREMTGMLDTCLLYTSPSPRDRQKSRMPSSA